MITDFVVANGHFRLDDVVRWDERLWIIERIERNGLAWLWNGNHFDGTPSIAIVSLVEVDFVHRFATDEHFYAIR